MTIRDDISNLLEEVWAARAMPGPEEAARIRKAAGITQARMARVCGVARSTVARWENGTMRPHTKQRVKWAAVLAALEDTLR